MSLSLARAAACATFAAPPRWLALTYLAALSVAEVLTALAEPRIGLILYSLLLMSLLLHATLCWEDASSRLLLALVLVPLSRLLSFCLPLAGFPVLWWYLIISVPLFVAAANAVRILGFSWTQTGVTLRALPLQVLVGLSGVAFGYIQYHILQPAPLISALTWEQVWLPALNLLFSTGFTEELILRGVIQQAGIAALGRFAIVYVALLFALLQTGYQSPTNMLFVFGAGLFFGWVATTTRSIVGVTLAHGLTNIVLFLVWPFLLPGNPPPAR